MPEEHRPFDQLDQDDLRLYQQLSDLLRVFDVTVIYNFYAAGKEQRERLVTGMKKFIEGDEKAGAPYHDKGGYDLLNEILGDLYVCPLCPGERICTMCKPSPDMSHSASSLSGRS